MRKVAAVASLFLLLGVVIWWGWSAWLSVPKEFPRESTTASRNASPSAAFVRERESAAQGSSVTVTRMEEAFETADTDAARAAAEATWIVRGRTLLGWQKPRSNTAVHLQLFDGEDTNGEVLAELRTKSNHEGRFLWALRPPISTVTIRASSGEEGHKTATDTRVVAVGEPSPELELRILPLDCRVDGSVVGSQGAPLFEARVWTVDGETLTDSEGRYSLLSSSIREEARVYASSTGHAQARIVARLSGSGCVANVDFQLVAALQVEGRVVDEFGQPIQGASVTTFGTHDNEARTDAEGRFLLDHLDPRTTSHYVYARRDGFVEASTRVESASLTVEIDDLVLTRGVRLEGIVVDDRGQALPGAALYLGFSPSAYNRLDAKSAADGTFVFPHAPYGAQTLFTSAEGFAPNRRALQLDSEKPLVSGVRIQLSHGYFIGGIVQDLEESALSGVHVSVRHRGEYTDQRVQTGADGRFHLEELPEESIELEFFGKGIVRKRVPLERMDVEDLVVVVGRSGSLAGRVVDGRTGEALNDFLIRFVAPDPPSTRPGGYSANWAREGVRFTDTGGLWDSGDEDLVPGMVFGVEVRAEGYAPARLGKLVAEIEPDSAASLIQLLPGSRVFGRVIAVDGGPAVGARVLLRRGEEAGRSLDGEEQFAAGNTVTAADGSFVLDDVPVGSARLRVQMEGRPVHMDGPFEVLAGGAVERRIQLPRGSLLEGRLLAADSKPLGGELVVVSRDDERDAFRVEFRTDAEGRFTVDGLPAGSYSVSHHRVVGSMTLPSLSLLVTMVEGETTLVVLAPVGPCTLRGTVIPAEGESLPDEVQVMLIPLPFPEIDRSDLPPSRGTCALQGRFEIEGIEPGHYLVQVLYRVERSIRSARSELQVTDADTDFDITLSVGAAR